MSSYLGNLVQYSDSDSDEDSACRDDGGTEAGQNDMVDNPKKRLLKEKKKLLPVPNEIEQMFNDVKQSKLLKTEHFEGRVRAFPHEEGDWPSHAYIPAMPCHSLEVILAALVSKVQENLPGFTAIDKKELHISLSRTVSLRHYWIETILSKLKAVMTGLQSFSCHLDIVDLYTNDDRTRSFLGLRVIIGEEKLRALSQKVDQVFKEFGLPKYYEDPKFHISFAWHLGNVADDLLPDFLEDLQEHLDSLDAQLSDHNSHAEPRTLVVNDVFVKTGNKVFSLLGR